MENGHKNVPCQGKHRVFGNVVKTQGILLKHILMIKEIVTCATTFNNFVSKEMKVSSKSVLHMKHFQIIAVCMGNICGLTGKHR